jgi:hypothetical protein
MSHVTANIQIFKDGLMSGGSLDFSKGGGGGSTTEFGNRWGC